MKFPYPMSFSHDKILRGFFALFRGQKIYYNCKHNKQAKKAEKAVGVGDDIGKANMGGGDAYDYDGDFQLHCRKPRPCRQPLGQRKGICGRCGEDGQKQYDNVEICGQMPVIAGQTQHGQLHILNQIHV